MLFPWYTKYPYQNDEILNLDWILKTIENLVNEVANFVTLNTIKYADPIQWNITTQYEKNTVVIDPISGSAYISTKPVPAGVGLNNTDYWNIIFTLDVISANKNITLRDDANNMLATFESLVDDWLLWQGTLYIVTRDIDIGQAYVVDYNIERATVEYFMKLYIQNTIDYIDGKISKINDLIGDLTELTTTDKDSVVEAINEIVNTLSNVKDSIGDLEDLNTEDKDSIVEAINEVVGYLGILDNLETTTKTDLVAAINEVFEKIDDIESIEVINAKVRGAIGDGVTDNYALLQSLVSSNTSIYLPAGEYYISQPIQITGRNVNFFGDGDATVLIGLNNVIEISGYYHDIHDLAIRTKTNDSIGLKILASYSHFHRLFIRDVTYYFGRSIQFGQANSGVWFNIFENIYINDTSVSARQGTGIYCISTVNNVMTEIFINQKNEAIKFDSDNQVGYSTDGIQIENLNVTTCNYGIVAEGCTALYFNNLIIDQTVNYAAHLRNCKNVNISDGYLSAGSLSGTDFIAVVLSSCENTLISNCKITGTPSTYGFTIGGTGKFITIRDCWFGNFTTAIAFSTATNSDCLIDNCYFDSGITTKLSLQGIRVLYKDLSGSGSVTIYQGEQIASTFFYNSGSYTMDAAAYSANIDIPLPSGVAKPIYVGFEIFDNNSFYIWSYDYANSPSGKVRINVRKFDNTAFLATIKYSYMIPYVKS